MTLRETCVDQVAIALAFEVRDAAFGTLEQRAEALVTIAEKYGVPIQPVLLQWIHFRMPDKAWSGAEWARYCVKYNEAKRELTRLLNVEEQSLPPLEMVAWSPGRMLCTRCYDNEALEVLPETWICPSCGNIS
jgi:hypothetical protein